MSVISAYKCDNCGMIIEYDNNNPYDMGKTNYIRHLKKHAKVRLKVKKEILTRKEIDHKLDIFRKSITDVDYIKKYDMGYVLDDLYSISSMHIPMDQTILDKIEVYKKNGIIGIKLKYSIVNRLKYDFIKCTSHNNDFAHVDIQMYSIMFDIKLDNEIFHKIWTKLYSRAKLKTNSKKFNQNTFTIWKISDDKNLGI